MGLENEPPGLIGRGPFAIGFVCKKWVVRIASHKGLEPHAVTTELPNNWTQDGTEMLLGRYDRQGGNQLHYFRLIQMGDWYDSRNHTSKQRARGH